MSNVVSILGMMYGGLAMFLSAMEPSPSVNLGLQYGALGILGFMIWINSQERKSMCRDINTKDAALQNLLREQIQISTKMTDIADDMTNAIKNCRMAQMAEKLGGHDGKD